MKSKSPSFPEHPNRPWYDDELDDDDLEIRLLELEKHVLRLTDAVNRLYGFPHLQNN